MLVVPVHAVLTTSVSVRHSEILKLRVWLRLATLGANSKIEDGVPGTMLEKQGELARNKAMGPKGWSIMPTYLVRRWNGSLVSSCMAVLSESFPLVNSNTYGTTVLAHCLG